MIHKIHIKVDQYGVGTATLDGRPVETVAIGFNASIDELTEVTLVIPAGEVEIEAEVGEERLTVVEAHARS